MENTCLQSVAQGTPMSNRRTSRATGGNVSVNTCDPIDTRRIRVTQTGGQLNLSRTFVRLDTARFANNMAKTFISYSHSQADKWGPGWLKRDHVDAAFALDINADNKIVGVVLQQGRQQQLPDAQPRAAQQPWLLR